jgi:excisionase family DNA binding protein
MNRLLISVPEAARMLGISVRTVHRYCQYGILPFIRVGRRKLLPMADLVRFAETGVSVERLRHVKATVDSWTAESIVEL